MMEVFFWITAIFLVVVFIFLKAMSGDKEYEEGIRKSKISEEKQFQIASYLIQEKPKKFSSSIAALSIDEGQIEKKFNVLGSQAIDIFERSDGLVDIEEIEKVNNSPENWIEETTVCFVEDGFIIAEFPFYWLDINHHSGLDVDNLDIGKYKAEIDELEFEMTVLKFNDVADITYSDEKITVIAKELTSEASLKIFLTNTSDPIEFKVVPIDMSDYETTESLQEMPEEFIRFAHKDEAEVIKLKTLYHKMTAHMKRKDSLQLEQKKILEREKFSSPDLTDDAYQIFLTKEFEIHKNDTLEQFVVNNKLFHTVEQALEHADELYRNREK